MPARKQPRRTAERILETALELFNRFGEPNVSTTLIAAEVGISPGNLYYHYPAKDELANALHDAFEKSARELLPAAEAVRDIEDAWLFLHLLLELIWRYRFLYRDLNDLLSRNRHLETRFQGVLEAKTRAVRSLIDGLARGQAIALDPSSAEADALATTMVVLLTYWLSYEYVREPRRALEADAAAASMLRGAWQVLALLAPYLEVREREHLLALAGSYHPRNDGEESQDGEVDRLSA